MSATVRARVLVATWWDGERRRYQADGWDTGTEEQVRDSLLSVGIHSTNILWTIKEIEVPMPERPGQEPADP